MSMPLSGPTKEKATSPIAVPTLVLGGRSAGTMAIDNERGGIIWLFGGLGFGGGTRLAS